MPILYPSALDALTNPNAAGGDTLASVPHDSQHADANDAVEALETKLGTGASTPATAGHVLRVTGAGATAYQAIQEGDLPATVALDSDVTSAVAAHEADTTAVHGIADTSVLATDAEVASAVSTHAGEADPHSVYQKESEKGVASGYASLDASAMVPVSQVRAVNSGTSFPASPTTNDMFFRTDRGLLYFYDGTRWLTVNEYTMGMSILDTLQPRTADGTILYGVTDHFSTQQMWVTRWKAATLIVGTNDGSNYWTAQLVSVTGGGTEANLGSSFNTSADTAGFYASDETTVGAAVSASALRLIVKVTKTGAPSGVYMIASVKYRLIG